MTPAEHPAARTPADEIALCANDIHCQRTKAVARVSFPRGTYKATTACAGCLDWQLRQARAGVYPILIEPIGSQP